MVMDHGGMVVEGVVVDHNDMVQKEVDGKMLQKKQLVIVPPAVPMGMAKGNQSVHYVVVQLLG